MTHVTKQASHQADVRVVVGEAAPHVEGSLRSILEAAGLNVLGQASNPEDLERIVRAASPDVLVLDVAAGALTVLAARTWAPRTGIVVVWPADVLAEGADQHVESSHVATDLVPAVLAVAGRHRWSAPSPVPVADVIVLPDIDIDIDAEPAAPALYAVAPIVTPGVEVGEVARPAAPAPSKTMRGMRTSLGLVAAALALVVVVALGSQPVTPTGSLAQGAGPVPGQVPTPGEGGTGGDGGTGRPDLGPSATGPRNLVGSSSLTGLAQAARTPSLPRTTTSGGGSPGDPAPRHVPAKRRHRRRHHRRRHHRRRGGGHGGHDGGDPHGHSGDPHGHGGDSHEPRGGSVNASHPPSTHGNSDHGNADHGDAGDSGHGNSGHHGDPDD